MDDPFEQRPEINNRFNDFTFWFPLLKRIGMRVPKTAIVYCNIDLGPMVDGQKIKGLNDFISELKRATDYMGYPCFLRTGQTSDKHGWEQTCFVPSNVKNRADDLKQRVARLVEISYMANIAGLPWPFETWVVREMIPTKPLFYAFRNMPITKERRYFIKNGKVQCSHPYWPSEAFKNEAKTDWQGKMEELQSVSEDDKKELDAMALYIAHYFPGYWSVDFLQDKDGKWWVTDMALGDDSYHFPNCESIKQ